MVLSLFCLLVVGAASPVLAQEGATSLDRILTVGVIDEGCEAAVGGKDPCWDTKVLVANPGDKVTLRADLRPSAGTHNVHVKGIDPEQKTPLSSNQLHEVTFTMPSGTKGVTFVCDAHATMTATILPPAQAAASAGGGETEVPHLGVSFLAYWVGLIAFALLFIVYGLTFFLFKYNETPTTTDQWDRSDAAGARKFSAGSASLLALVFAAVVIGAVIYLARAA